MTTNLELKRGDPNLELKTHKLSVLKEVGIHTITVLLLIAVMGLTILNKQSSKSMSSSVPSASLPDLKADYMQVTFEKYDYCISNTGLGVKVWFSNTGEADAGSFVVAVNGKTQPVIGLPKGGSSSLWFASYSNPSTAIVDFTNTVIESDENNNQLIQQLPVPTIPAVPYCLNSYLPIVKKD